MLYGAYGSNLNLLQMAYRCPNSVPVGMGFIEGYKLQMSKYLTIVSCEGARVPVGLWEVPKKDIVSLDRYEGFPRFYTKKHFSVYCNFTDKESSIEDVMVYVMNGNPPLFPCTAEYVKCCTNGYLDFKLDLNYLKEVLKAVDMLP